MKVLSLDGLTDYNEKLLNKVEDMIDDSVSDCINDISVNESSIMFSKKDGTSENITLNISNADTLDGYHSDDFVYLSNFIAGKLGSKTIYYSTNSGKDCNDIEDFLVLAGGEDGLHYPTKNTYYYILTFKYSNTSKKQIAFGYNGNVVDNILFRTCNDNVWTDWKKVNDNGDADTIDGVHAWNMQTLSSIGQPHGSTNWLMKIQHDIDGDGYFKIVCGDGSVQTKVDRASISTNASNADTVDGYHASSFCKTGFASSTNMNELTTSGTYRINSGNTNAPAGSDWGQVLVIHGGGDTIAQLIFDFTYGKCWLRTGNSSDVGGGGAWTEWRQLYTSQNITYGTSALTPGSSALSTGSFYYQYE